jgi:predicted FMN-binding regulatory protein PaiB
MIPRTPPTSQIPGSFPIPPTGTETQEPDAQGVATSSVSNKVAETQEPTTHFIAKTQEPATHSVAETQEPTIAATQEPATAETQELVVDIEIEIQESEVHGAATLLSSNKLAETQEPATHSIAETQEPATHSVAETQEPALAATQEPATAETQEPTVDIEIEIQESEVQGAATLLSFHQEDETQEAAANPVAAPQKPASATMTAT